MRSQNIPDPVDRPALREAVATQLAGPRSPFELKAGDLIAAVLLTEVDTARPGPVVAMVSQDVRDTVSGRFLLAPRGARLIGRQEGDSRHGERRAYVVWTRLILPNGKSVALANEPMVDALGAVGMEGRVQRRLGAVAGGVLAGGALTALGQMARDGRSGDGGWFGDVGDAAAIEGARVGGRLVDRELAVQPSIQVAAGSAVRVLLTSDLILEPYAP